MKKIVIILFIIFSTFIITGCDMDVDSLKEKFKEVQNDDDGCKGWKENGKCPSVIIHRSCDTEISTLVWKVSKCV